MSTQAPILHNVIAEVDKAIALCRSGQLDATTPTAKEKWAERIDGLLDERSRLTALCRASDTAATYSSISQKPNTQP